MDLFTLLPQKARLVWHKKYPLATTMASFLRACCTFKNPKGATPTPMSVHSPRPSFYATAENIAALLSHPTSSSSNAKKLVSKKFPKCCSEAPQALMRDNYRYILPRNVDKDSAINGLTVINMDVGERMRGTGPGHIFNELMTDHIVGLSDAAQRKLEWAFSAAAIVQRFAQISVVQELNRNNIHRAENTFTTTRDFHGLFDELSVSLHPIGQDDSHTYEIRTYPLRRNAAYGLPDQVTLRMRPAGKFLFPAVAIFNSIMLVPTFPISQGQGRSWDSYSTM